MLSHWIASVASLLAMTDANKKRPGMNRGVLFAVKAKPVGLNPS
jgi:hypothetical protein